MTHQPALDQRRLMGGVDVHHRMYIELRWHVGFDGVEELAGIFGRLDTWRPAAVEADRLDPEPPLIARGVCQGVRDVTNLCWKLIEVLRGSAAGANGTLFHQP